MGFGHGGRRPGAGRKPGSGRQPPKRGVVLGLNGARLEAGQEVDAGFLTAPDPDDPSTLLVPPRDLSPAEKRAWRTHAPLAIAERTLDAARVPGFKRLCRLVVNANEIHDRIVVLDRTTAEADRLMRRWEKAEMLLSASLQQFRLTGAGKPEAPPKKSAASTPNPWALLAGEASR